MKFSLKRFGDFPVTLINKMKVTETSKLHYFFTFRSGTIVPKDIIGD